MYLRIDIIKHETYTRKCLLTIATWGSTIRITTWACNNAYANCGFCSNICLASVGLFFCKTNIIISNTIKLAKDYSNNFVMKIDINRYFIFLQSIWIIPCEYIFIYCSLLPSRISFFLLCNMSQTLVYTWHSNNHHRYSLWPVAM